MRKLVLVALILAGCGLLPSNPEVDPAFSILYSQFLMEAVKYHRELNLNNLVMKFGPLDPALAGTCSNGPTVTIAEDYWHEITAWEKEILIYHELGHCLLGQAHRANSIMSSPEINYYSYAWHRDTYVAELFNYSPYSTQSRSDYEINESEQCAGYPGRTCISTDPRH